MNKVLFIFIISLVSYAFPQDTVKIPYYSLQVNSKWEYSSKENFLLSKAIKDTIMPNGKTYTMIVDYEEMPGKRMTGIRYERSDSGKIFRYNSSIFNEDLWFDFSLEPGDTINVISDSSHFTEIIFWGTFNEEVLGKSLLVWRFIIDTSHQFYLRDAIDIADSLGIIRYLITDRSLQRDSLNITGAFIDSLLIRSSYPYIYLPYNPGNWWKFDDGSTMTAVRDTIMPNGREYTFVLWEEMYYSKYLRQDEHLVFSYDTILNVENVEIDMSAPLGIWDLFYDENDEYTPLFILFSTGMSTDIVFSETRKIFGHGDDIPNLADATTLYAYADSIGIIFLSGGWLFLEVIEAYVDGKHYIANSVKPTSIAAGKYVLQQNYPNPFNPTTRIIYSVPADGLISLKVFDILGRETATIVNDFIRAGEHKVIFNASHLPSGIYFYELKTGSYRSVRKMMLLK